MQFRGTTLVMQHRDPTLGIRTAVMFAATFECEPSRLSFCMLPIGGNLT